MKNKDIQQLSVNDLKEKIKEEKTVLTKLKLSHGVSAIENPLKIRNTRRLIAKLATELNKKSK